ncbi:MAG: hypothetical protein E7645_08030 [Ruminococcaceae bacterium]|nr:hypothetical protein [Oscillospiraceae bacterium]
MTSPMLETTEIATDIHEQSSQPRTYTPVKRKKRFKDRKEGRYLRTINAMNKFMPFIMPQRCDALNSFAETMDVTRADAFVKDMIAAGYENFSFLHVMLAAYVRTVSQKPGINRFVSGQRIYARNNIEVVMTIKKEMSLESPDTCIKVYFEPDDTIEEIYEKFNATVAKEKETAELGSDFDKTANTLANLPRPILRFVVRMLNWMDYHGWLPKFLTGVSPFHGSMIITSMGSLGIKPIYHHIYNFGNLPIFVAYGVKRTVKEPQTDGSSKTRRLIDLKVVTDERICDGYYFASAFKLMRRYAENPALLQKRPEEVFEDID